MPDLNTIEFFRKKSLRVIQKLLLVRGVDFVRCTPCRENSMQNQYSATPKEPLILGRTHQKQLLSQARCHVHPFGKKVFHRTTKWLVHYSLSTNCHGMAFCVIQQNFFVIRVIFWACPNVLEKLHEIRKIHRT